MENLAGRMALEYLSQLPERTRLLDAQNRDRSTFGRHANDAHYAFREHLSDWNLFRKSRSPDAIFLWTQQVPPNHKIFFSIYIK
jgi:hypothetical protein